MTINRNLGQQVVLFIPQRKYKQTTLTIVLPILILGWVSMMAILIPVKSGEKISFLIAIELGLVFIIATLDTNMVPAGRGFKLGFDILIFKKKNVFDVFRVRSGMAIRTSDCVVHDKFRRDFEPDLSFHSFVGWF